MKLLKTDEKNGEMWMGAKFAILLLIFMILAPQLSQTKKYLHAYDWMKYDRFDELDDRMMQVNEFNCASKSASELRLPANSVAQPPMFNRLLSYIVYPNRSNLLHAHNMALNRAFFYSYIFQKLSNSSQFPMQPGFLYYYFSAIADVSANPDNINGSAIFFDKDTSFATWFETLPFNKTLALYGPNAYRFDDYIEPTNWIREPTNRTINALDLGTKLTNYTLKSYKINQWYDLFLPDKKVDATEDSQKKFPYSIGIKYSNQTGKFTSNVFNTTNIHGPPSPGQKDSEHLPVLFTEPYFDCGRSNRWIVSAVSPVVDFIPRYLKWFHLRRNTYVAVTTMDVEFLDIDFNPCPLSMGHMGPNYLHGIDRCKDTTICEPLYGWGFRRGGYKCMCKPGYRLPPWQIGPFLGIEIESATYWEYENGFDCIPVELRHVIPVIRGNDTEGTPDFDVDYKKRRKRSLFDDDDENEEEDEDEEFLNDEEKFGIDCKRPESARKTDRALLTVPDDVLQSRILNKRLRLLRLLNLKESEVEIDDPNYLFPLHGSHNKETSPKLIVQKVVPRVSHYYHLQNITNRKIQYIPSYDRQSVKRRRRVKRQSFDEGAHSRMTKILNFKTSVNGENCKNFKKDELYLPGDVGYNVDHVFSNQARTALRLSHFLSNFLQNVDKYEEYGNLRGDRLLNIEQIFGEVLANTMGDLKMKGSGVFFDLNKFVDENGNTKELFGPYAYRYEKPPSENSPNNDVANTNFRAIDKAGLPENYIDEPWFKNIKERWQSNTYGLLRFREKLRIRSDQNGTSQVDFLLYPMYYQAPRVEDGIWSVPYFTCDGDIDEWVVTYSTPFFGLNSVGTDIEFKGVVTVDVRLDELDIVQCPQDYFVPNAFKDTARCHYESTYCVPILGWGFKIGAYKCNCKVGYEYPFNDNQWYFDGQTMEEEFRKLIDGDKQTRYKNLVCRVSRSSKFFTNLPLIFITVFLSLRHFSN